MRAISKLLRARCEVWSKAEGSGAVPVTDDTEAESDGTRSCSEPWHAEVRHVGPG